MSRPMNLGREGADELLTRPISETSVEQLASLFASGEKPPSEWMLGLEIELIPFHRAQPEGAVEHTEVGAILERLAADRSLEIEREPHGATVGVKGGGVLISIEPGGQIEYASHPHRKLKKLRAEAEGFCDSMKAAAQSAGVGFWALGHQPYLDRNSAAKMPKARYDLMRAFMPTRGSRGLDMMHLTGSVQCAVDYESESNMIEKVRCAAKASPFISALAASSPFSSGKPNGYKSQRYEIWRHTDPRRCGLWPEMVDEEGLSYRRYVEHALAAPAMFFMRKGQFRLPPDARSFEAYADGGFEDSPVTVGDFLDHLTTMFPEIRLKSYIELRGADCAPPREAVAIAGFWRGLLDDEATCRAAAERLAPLGYEDLLALQPAIAKLGLQAMSPIGPVHEVVEWLVEASYGRMKKGAPDCAECLEPIVARARAGMSLADEMLERAEQTSVIDALGLVEI